MKKRILSLLFALVLLFSFVSCGKEKYPPVASTAEENRTVFTLTVEGRRYDVKYELYRALFLMLRDRVTGGNDALLSSEGGAENVKRVTDLVTEEAKNIYAVFALCDKLGIRLDTKDIQNEIDDYVTVSVEGGYFGGNEVTGFGTYEKYLAALKADGLNYSTQILLYRYVIAERALELYYGGNTDSSIKDNAWLGHLSFTEEDLLNFYRSDDTHHVVWGYLPSSVYDATRAQSFAENLRNVVRENTVVAEREMAVENYIIGHTTSAEVEIRRGELVTPYNLDPRNYGVLTSAVMALSEGEVSDPVLITSDAFDGFFVAYRKQKVADFVNSERDLVISAFIQDHIGKELAAVTDAFTVDVKKDASLITVDEMLAYPKS